MEPIGAVIERERTQTLSQNQQNSTTSIPREQHVALFAVINKVRMLNGWTTKTAQELDATIRTWAEVLNQYRIPIEHYNECYLRAVDTRQRKLQDGKEIELDATLLAAAWQSGLSREVHERRVQEKRYLTSTAESECPRCFGSGMETVPGKGAKICGHEPLTASEIAEREEKKTAPPKLRVVEKQAKPRPNSAQGILTQAMLDGGDGEKILRIKNYLRKAEETNQA